MNLSFTKTLVKNVYTIQVSTSGFSASDLSLFELYNEPTINLGGQIKNGQNETIATIQAINRKIKSQFPFTISFTDSQYDGNAEQVAEGWVELVKSNATSAMNELRQNIDNFTGTEDFVI